MAKNKIILGGILKNSIGNSYCFKVKGSVAALQKIKLKLQKEFSKQGLNVEVEHAYFDKGVD
jgi:hypothetical protein